jgi:hypothetical protein
MATPRDAHYGTPRLNKERGLPRPALEGVGRSTTKGRSKISVNQRGDHDEQDRGSKRLPIAALAVVAVLSACAETKQVAMKEPMPASAVLPQPALLEKGQGGQVDQVYLNPSADWASYTKVILDPVTIWTGPGATPF